MDTNKKNLWNLSNYKVLETEGLRTNRSKTYNKYYAFMLAFSIFLSGCKKLVEIDPPVTQVTGASVYASDATAAAVLTGMYANLSMDYYGPDNYSLATFSLYGGLSSDEFSLYDESNPGYVAFFKNALSINTDGYEFWSGIYSYIFSCNSAIVGLNESTTLTPSVKQQLLGEAKFMRAFFYFYLINMYGDAPLILNTDYKYNSSLARTEKGQIYNQIIVDLTDAENLLSANYLDGSLLKTASERTRPTKWAAAALLSRAYLYVGDWKNAEIESSKIIANTGIYALASDLNAVFIKNSVEAIWQLQPVTNEPTNTQEAYYFILPPTGPDSYWNVYLSDSLVNAFEPGDDRRHKWIDSISVNGTTYFYPYKYKVNDLDAPVTEYLMVFRLSEQYLIRAEARAHSNNILSAQADLDAVRNRANLPNTSANDLPSLLSAILHERRVELFTEFGHRWLDLKRTGTVDNVMGKVAQLKGETWHSYQQLYPIPSFDIDKDRNITQNVGY